MPVQYTAAKWLLFVALAVLVATGVAQRTVELATAPVDPDELLVQQFEQRHECVARTDGYLAAITSPSVDNPAPYSSSAFFDCWRSADEMDAFLSALAGLHPQFLTRLPSIAVSAELRDIPAYLLSVDANDTAAKDAVYLQGLSHAREWQSGGSVAFAAVSMLDGLLAGDVAILSVGPAVLPSPPQWVSLAPFFCRQRAASTGSSCPCSTWTATATPSIARRRASGARTAAAWPARAPDASPSAWTSTETSPCRSTPRARPTPTAAHPPTRTRGRRR
jgi:hypothetical protein